MTNHAESFAVVAQRSSKKFILLPQCRNLQCAVHQSTKSSQVERFFEVIVSTAFDRLDCYVQRTMTSHQDNFRFRSLVLNVSDHFYSSSIRQAEVSDYKIELCAVQDRD